MTLIPPFYIDAVVAIGVPTEKGTNWVGTGFIYGKHHEEEIYELYVVTNKHVLNGRDKIIIRFNSIGDEPDKDFNIDTKFPNGRLKWVGHSDDNIDIGALWINHDVLVEHNVKISFFRSNLNTLNRAGLKDEEVCEGDGIFALGFPMGHVGGIDRQYVICRQGCIARIQDALVGGQTFLIDAPVFPGNSGGPVILKPEMTAIQGTKVHKSAKLIGIVSAYLPYADSAVSSQTKRARIVFEENTGLSIVYPIDYVEETVELASKRIQSRLKKQQQKRKKANQ